MYVCMYVYIYIYIYMWLEELRPRLPRTWARRESYPVVHPILE